MRRLAMQLNKGLCLLAGGLLLAGLLGACTEVQVTVDTCQTRTGSSFSGDPVGTCNQGILLVADTDAAGFWIRSTPPTQIPLTDHSYLCHATGYKCQPTPGTCQFKPCKTWFTPDSAGAKIGTCNCGCP